MSEVFGGFQRTEVMGVPVLWLPDDRFKTFRMHLSARRPLDGRTAERSLLPSLLMQGTANYPDRPALARQMERLYGATVAPSSAKVGETHVLRFSVDCVAGRFLPDRPDQLARGLEFLSEYLVRPRLDGVGFPAEVFERERQQAVHDARAVIDDRAAYAAQQVLSRACEGEPMAIPAHGGVPAIEAMDRYAPEQARDDFLRHGQLLVIGMGALPGETEVLTQVEKFLRDLPPSVPEELPAPVERVIDGRRASVERVELQQSKMVLVFRLPATEDPELWMGRALFCSMLGGGPHSRLFREVREERSLAYYAQAVLDRHKGLLLVHVGLDEPAAEAVESETLKQVEALRAGRFEPAELETARVGLLSTIAMLTDGIRSNMQFVEDQWNLGLDRTPADLAESYRGVTAEQLRQGVEGMQLDYSYLLAPASDAGDASDTGDAEAQGGAG